MSLGYLREQVNYDNKLDDKAMRYHAEGVTERLLGVRGEDVYRVAPAYLYFKKINLQCIIFGQFQGAAT